MKDVTPIFETYRECARHLRNTYFSTRDNEDWEIIEDFEAVASVLFERLVLGQLAEERCCGSHFEPELQSMIKDNKIKIVPAADRMPVMISRELNSGYWDYPIQCLEPEDTEISFKSYFDWDQFGLIDFRYYLGIITSSTKYPDIVGHEVLIETIYGKVIYEERLTVA